MWELNAFPRNSIRYALEIGEHIPQLGVGRVREEELDSIQSPEGGSRKSKLATLDPVPGQPVWVFSGQTLVWWNWINRLTNAYNLWTWKDVPDTEDEDVFSYFIAAGSSLLTKRWRAGEARTRGRRRQTWELGPRSHGSWKLLGNWRGVWEGGNATGPSPGQNQRRLSGSGHPLGIFQKHLQRVGGRTLKIM